MLRTFATSTVRLAATRTPSRHAFHSTSHAASQQPNAPLDLDPSFRALLNDVDLSVLKHMGRHAAESTMAPGPRELEVFPDLVETQEDYMTAAELDVQDEEELDTKAKRKSPAALFGSQSIGSVVVPLELQDAITRLIAASDKSMLHVDAKRLFLSDESNEDPDWDTSYDTKYKSQKAGARHEARDGTAFASIALPAHYSAISAVLDHAKLRLGPNWNVEHIIDWGAGSGSALWASMHCFQKPPLTANEDVLLEDTPQISNTSVASYLGIDKRDGLVSIGQKLVDSVSDGTSISWKRSYHGAEKPVRSNGEILAISAFTMSTLPTPLARKALVKEMWESGAETIVLIDHNTKAGFVNVAEAREFLLKQGRKVNEIPEAFDGECHVIAPCPHDGACPIYFSGSTRNVCGFSQRLQRPDFLRWTKHSGVGHEDIGYSYVVIRRGPRPVRSITTVGRVGQVGQREEAKQRLAQQPVVELVMDGVNLAEHRIEEEADLDAAALDLAEPMLSAEDLEATLRAEAYNWPRLVFPPMKKAGHIIIDGCTSEGKIMRLTVPKSQGKQPFYDARKSEWGDIFPHDPKNTPQIRFEAKVLNANKIWNGPDATKQKKKTRATPEAMLNSEIEREKGRVREERKAARMNRNGL